MQLKHILAGRCTCGSDVKAESLGFVHTNGTRQETRTFDCGCTLEYVPNFCEVRKLVPCPKSKEETNKNNTRQQLLAQLGAVIDRSKADDVFKDRLRSYMGLS